MGIDNMKHGTLVYDEEYDRIDIRFGLDGYYGGLHCGETMEVLIGGRWMPTRIEKGLDWYLIGVKTESLVGLQVRK
jgi:hypothetical protein